MITINVNGRRYDVDDTAETPLLWVLRDTVGLTGTKYGCGMGLCGSCTVHVDGQPARSCMTPVSAVVGQEITTIEGLTPDGNHPLQVAWRELNVPQCGYCQAGQIMNAAALLRDDPEPTAAAIDAAMQGNLCRCGAYQRIRAAIGLAAQGGRGS